MDTMSTLSSKQSVSAVLEAADQTADSTGELPTELDEASATEPEIVDMHANGAFGEADASSEPTHTRAASQPEAPAPELDVSDNTDAHHDTADVLDGIGRDRHCTAGTEAVTAVPPVHKRLT